MRSLAAALVVPATLGAPAASASTPVTVLSGTSIGVGIDLGAPVGATPATAESLRDVHGAYVRRFARGVVYVNPGDAPIVEQGPAGSVRLVPVGGGAVPASGRLPATWRLTRQRVQSFTLGPHEAAVLTLAATG